MMKKLLMALVLSLVVSTSCFAAGASGRFAAEEKAADALIAVLTGHGGTYEQVSKSFAQPLKAQLTAEKFKAVQDAYKTQIGTVKNIAFVRLVKEYNIEKGYSGRDELMYMGTAGKDKSVHIFVLFVLENNAPKVIGFRPRVFSLQAQPPAGVQDNVKK